MRSSPWRPLIEEEAASEGERADIASVIYNRLASKELPCLQLDSTVYYAAELMGESFDTNLDNPYNTYRYEGLPPGPIDNPGMNFPSGLPWPPIRRTITTSLTAPTVSATSIVTLTASRPS